MPGGAGDHAPAYSPDGSRIAFRRGSDVWIANADGQAAARIAFAPTSEAVPSWQALPAPDVAISQAVQPTNATVGSPVTFTVSVTNRGTAAASSVVVTDRLPATTTLISASPAGRLLHRFADAALRRWGPSRFPALSRSS